MITGLGFSIGSVNSVSAMVTGERPLSSVRTRRTAVTFDGAGGIRIGGIPQFDMAVTDFADLARDPESVVVGGRFWSPANLVAAVVNGLLESFPPTTGAVVTYPACYSDKQLSLLRQALNLAGATEVLLIPEPVAAAEWLEQERGPLESGFVLVYDLGGASLDVSMVRVGPDWDDHPIIGKSVRSYDFGGRPLGSIIARCARVAEPGDNGSMLQMTSIVDITTMRTQHIRDSLDVVHECIASTGRKLSDITCILLVGGASRPVEVARILAELGRPVVMSADPGQTIAVGAANYAARSIARLPTGGRHRAPKVAVFSSAAVASAVAVSAVTVFGGPSIPSGPSSLVDASPGGSPLGNVLFEPRVGSRAEAGSVAVNWAAAGDSGYSGRAAFEIAPAAYTPPTEPSLGPSVAEAHGGRHSEPRGGTSHSGGVTYANPAQFLNSLPFVRSPQAIPAAPNQPATGTPIPNIGLPRSVPLNPAPASRGRGATYPGRGATYPGGGVSYPGSGASSRGGGASSRDGGGVSSPGGGVSSPGRGVPSPGGTATNSGGTATPGTTASGTGGTSTVVGAPGTTAGEIPIGTVTPGGTASGGRGSGGSAGNASGVTSWDSSGSTSGDSSGGSLGGTSGGSTSTGTSGGSTGGGTSGHSTGGGVSGGSTGGGASGGSTRGATSGGATNSSASRSTGGGAAEGSINGSASGGSTGGSTSGRSAGGGTSGSMGSGMSDGGMSGPPTSGGMSGGSTGGASSGGGVHSGGASSGGGVHSGGTSSGGAFSPGLGGFGGGGGPRR